MIGVTRVLSAALISVGLALSGGPARAEPPAATTAQTLWDSLRTGAAEALDYGSRMVRSVTGWLFPGGGEDEAKTGDVHGLFSLSEKEFRDFEQLVRTAGYALQGYSFGTEEDADLVELAFEFERVISARERAELLRQLDQLSGGLAATRRTIILGLLDATRYVDASPASGYRLAGLTMRLNTPPDVRIRFRRTKP